MTGPNMQVMRVKQERRFAVVTTRWPSWHPELQVFMRYVCLLVIHSNQGPVFSGESILGLRGNLGEMKNTGRTELLSSAVDVR